MATVPIIDKTADAGFGNKFGQLQDVQGIVIHHTGGGGDVGGVINTFQERNFPAQYVIDQQGNVYQTLPSGAKGQQIVPGSDPSTGKALNNSNTIGIEIIGANDAAWNKAQIAAAQALTGQLQQQYGLPQSAVYGHSEVNPKDRENEGAALASAIRTGTPYQAGGDPYAKGSPTQVAAVSPSTAPSLYPGVGQGAGQLASYNPTSSYLLPSQQAQNVNFDPRTASLPSAAGLQFASSSPPSAGTPPPAQSQAQSWLPSSLQSDALSGGSSPSRQFNWLGNSSPTGFQPSEAANIPTGPYGADAVVKAGLSGDPAALKTAMDAVLAKAIATDNVFGIPNIGKIQDNLQGYFNTVQQQAPGAVRQLQSGLASNPKLNAVVPDAMRPMLDKAFGSLPPSPTANLPAPNLRPPMSQGTPSQALVAGNKTPPPNPLPPQLTGYHSSQPPDAPASHSLPPWSPDQMGSLSPVNPGNSQFAFPPSNDQPQDTSGFSSSAWGTPPSGAPNIPAGIGSFGTSGYNSPPTASGGFNASTMYGGPSSFDAPPDATSPFTSAAFGNPGGSSNPLPFGNPSSGQAGISTSPADQFSFSNYAPQEAPQEPQQQASGPSWAPTPQQTWDFGGPQSQPQDTFNASAFGSPISGPSSTPASLASYGSTGYDEPASSSGFSASTFGGGPTLLNPPSPTTPFSVSTFPQPDVPSSLSSQSSAPMGSYGSAPSMGSYPPTTPGSIQASALFDPYAGGPNFGPAPVPASSTPAYPQQPPNIAGNALLGFGTPMGSRSMTGTPTPASFMPGGATGMGVAAYLANGLPNVPKSAAPTVAAPKPQVTLPWVRPPQPTAKTATYSNGGVTGSKAKPVAAQPSWQDTPSIMPSGVTQTGAFSAGSGGASYDTQVGVDQYGNRYASYVDDNGNQHDTNLSNSGYEAPDSNTISPQEMADNAASATVLCTHYHRKGWLSRRLWLADARFARTLPHRVRRGYWRWAIPTVRRLQRGSPILEWMLWYAVVRPWATFAGWKMNRVRRRPLSGAFVHLALGSLSWVLGGKD